MERDGQVYIPDGSFQLLSGDVMTFICPSRDSKQFLRKLGFQTHQVKSAMIIGGSKAGYYLARRLLQMGVEVRIIESKSAAPIR